MRSSGKPPRPALLLGAAALLLLLSTLWHDWAGPSLYLRPTLPLQIGNGRFLLWRACTSRERWLGLRRATPDDLAPAADGRLPGMLFVFPDAGILRFTMRDVEMDLDLAFVDADGRLLQLVTMRANAAPDQVSPVPARYAVEARAGGLHATGRAPGQPLFDAETRRRIDRFCEPR